MPERYYFTLIEVISINVPTLMIVTAAGGQIMTCKLSSTALHTYQARPSSITFIASRPDQGMLSV